MWIASTVDVTYALMKKLALSISKIENYCWMRETSLSLSVDIGENSNYPDWEPLKHQFLCNHKDNDKDLLEINSDQPDSGYHRDKERQR